MKKILSVVIPTYNEERDIAHCLTTLLEQSYDNVEIIVVDDGSSDRTREIVSSFKKVKLIEGQHKGPGFSRNLGSSKAKGEILIFVDADMFFDKDYLKNLTKPIIDKKCIGTEERFQKASNMDNVWSRCWGSYVKGYPDKIKKGNVFRAILKSEFVRMGGFDPKYGYADDLTFYYKYGVKSNLVDNAICYHKNPSNLKEIYKQSRWIGASLNNNYKILSVPVINYLIAIALVPMFLFIVPYLSVYKSLSRGHYTLLGYYFVFYSVRYYGSLKGIFRKIALGKNTR